LAVGDGDSTCSASQIMLIIPFSFHVIFVYLIVSYVSIHLWIFPDMSKADSLAGVGVFSEESEEDD
jgi:hypothetical protein